MCGFIGVGGSTFIQSKRTSIISAFKWLSHRGPDQENSVDLDNFFIGFHRLAIVGVNNDQANQPICINNGKYKIIFNGEIFNFRTLAKSKLTYDELPYQVINSDSRVLAKLIEVYDLKCLDWLDGMFSIAIINDESGEVRLIRDRYGIKPLYYIVKDNNIIFASHIRAILEITSDAKANEDVIYTYLFTGLYDHTEQTFFKNINSVEPGSIVQFNIFSRKITKYKWYDIYTYLQIRERNSYAELLDEVEETIFDVIKDYIPNEVGCCINASGGVDSSFLVNNVCKLKPDLIIQNQDYVAPYSEKEWIDQYAKRFSINPIYHLITPDFLVNDIQETIVYQGQPFGGVTVPGYTPLYKNARSLNCKVVLDGTGLDESFLGYPRYRTSVVDESNYFWEKSLKGSSSATDPKGLRTNAISFKLGLNNHLINPNLIKSKLSEIEYSRSLSLLDILYHKIPRTTRFTDHASSRFSLELRSPFLSHRIMHLGMSINTDLLLSERGTKLPIRDILARNGLPHIAYAPKRYIQSPQNNWLANELKDFVKSYILSESFFSRGWIKSEIVIEEFNKYLNSKKENSFFIWQWLSLELWARTYLD